MSSYLFLAGVTVLLLITMAASVLYYKRIRRARKEYEEARNTVSDITTSFNKQFQRQGAALGVVTHKIELLSFENEKVSRKVEEYDERLAGLAAIIEDAPAIEKTLSTQIKEINKKVDEIKAAQNRFTQKISEVEKMRYRPQVSEAKIEAAIPIKKEKALAPLTETELTALETIAKEGEKTAPEIKEKIGLTREHTARLMKKLYEEGYLERDTNKMPFVYRLKEEMQKILKKREAKA